MYDYLIVGSGLFEVVVSHKMKVVGKLCDIYVFKQL